MAYQNFMGNKDFHPSSIRNLRKLYEAQEKVKLEEKRQEELRVQYLKEQEIYQTKKLMGKANPLNFMYEPPPGFAKDNEGKPKNDDDVDEAGEPRLKFDWQKDGKAPPREEFDRSKELRDKPFGIEVRNVKCIKCGKWGHINTDRECPLFGKIKPGTETVAVTHPILTDWDSIDDGLKFKTCAKDRAVNSTDPLQQYVHSDDEDTEVQQLLAQFTDKQRHRIIKKLAKAEEKKASSGHHHKGKKKKRKHNRTDPSDSESSEDEKTRRKKKKKHRRKYSDSEDDQEYKRKKREYESDESENEKRKTARRHESGSSEVMTSKRDRRSEQHTSRYDRERRHTSKSDSSHGDDSTRASIARHSYHHYDHK